MSNLDNINLYPEMNKQISDLLAMSTEPMYLYAAKYIKQLEEEHEKYKSYAKRIEGLPDCNTCADKWRCAKCPAPGENTRINCPLWREQISP